MAIVQFARFKSDKPEEMVKAAKQGKAILKTWRRISSAVPIPHRRVGRRVAHFHALLQWGRVWKRCRRPVAKDPAFASSPSSAG